MSFGVAFECSHVTLGNKHLLEEVTSVEMCMTNLIHLPDHCPLHFTAQHLLSVGRKGVECLQDEGKVGKCDQSLNALASVTGTGN